MGLLKSIDNVPGIDFYEYRDSQYYNKYDYRMRIKIPCIRYTWYCKSPEDLEKKIRGEKVGWSRIRPEDLDTVIDNVDALKTIIKLQQARKQTKNLGLRIEGSSVALYSVDLQSLIDIQQMIGDRYDCDFTMVQLSTFIGVKYFAGKPKHNYRIYLKSRRVEGSFAVDLHELFKKNKKLHPCPSLKDWAKGSINNQVSWRYRFSNANHFIDYDDESMLSYLALMYGNMLGKRYKLEKRPDLT